MDATRCPTCEKRMKAVVGADGRTDLRCLRCDKVDPLRTDAIKWAQSPLAAPLAELTTAVMAPAVIFALSLLV
jgi:hypothetical protein